METKEEVEQIEIPESFSISEAKQFFEVANNVLTSRSSNFIEKAEACEVAGYKIILPTYI